MEEFPSPRVAKVSWAPLEAVHTMVLVLKAEAEEAEELGTTALAVEAQEEVRMKASEAEDSGTRVLAVVVLDMTALVAVVLGMMV